MSGAGAARLVVPADHPALAGHFPGRPIVPGVMLLDAVLGAVRDAGFHPVGLRRAKFTAPVASGTAVTIALAPGATDRVAFTCRANDAVVLMGEVACQTARP